MKALIIGQKLSRSTLESHHGRGIYTRRLLVKNLDNLCITLDGDFVHAFTGFNDNPNQYYVHVEVEVPDELIKKAAILAAAQVELDKLAKQFESFLGQSTDL